MKLLKNWSSCKNLKFFDSLLPYTIEKDHKKSKDFFEIYFHCNIELRRLNKNSNFVLQKPLYIYIGND